MNAKRLSVLMLLCGSLLSACAADDTSTSDRGSVTSTGQVIQGQLVLNTFASAPTGVRLSQGGQTLQEVGIAADGSFSVNVEPGTDYTLQVITAQSEVTLVFPRREGSIDASFDVATAGAPFSLGLVRYIGDPLSQSYEFAQTLQNKAGETPEDEAPETETPDTEGSADDTDDAEGAEDTDAPEAEGDDDESAEDESEDEEEGDDDFDSDDDGSWEVDDDTDDDIACEDDSEEGDDSDDEGDDSEDDGDDDSDETDDSDAADEDADDDAADDADDASEPDDGADEGSSDNKDLNIEEITEAALPEHNVPATVDCSP